MERWQFIQSPTGSWYWLCSDVMSRKTKTSAATFATKSECIANATSCGYGKASQFGRPFAPKRAPRAKRSKAG